MVEKSIATVRQSAIAWRLVELKFSSKCFVDNMHVDNSFITALKLREKLHRVNLPSLPGLLGKIKCASTMLFPREVYKNALSPFFTSLLNIIENHKFKNKHRNKMVNFFFICPLMWCNFSGKPEERKILEDAVRSEVLEAKLTPLLQKYGIS